MDEPPESRRGRVRAGPLLAVLATAGLAVLTVGVLLLTTWEVPLFRLTTVDHDFTGLECGTPLDNPGWVTGSPCHGAVNRQAGIAWLLTLTGSVSTAAAIGASLTGRHGRRSGLPPTRPETTA